MEDKTPEKWTTKGGILGQISGTSQNVTITKNGRIYISKAARIQKKK